MTNKSVEIHNIVAELRTISTITAITWNRIYFWEPIENQSGIYVCVNLISQVPDEVYKTARIECRIIWHNENVTKKALIDLQNIITTEIVYNQCLWLKDYNWFTVFKTTEWWTFQMFTDDQWRNLLIKDYILYFTN
jgi:hypothetical protein